MRRMDTRRNKSSRKPKDRDMPDHFAAFHDIWDALSGSRVHRCERAALRCTTPEHTESNHHLFDHGPTLYAYCPYRKEWISPHTDVFSHRAGNRSYATETRAPPGTHSPSSHCAENHSKPRIRYRTELREPRNGSGYEHKYDDTGKDARVHHGEFPEYTRYYCASPAPMSPQRRAKYGPSKRTGATDYTTENRYPFSSSSGYPPYTSSSSSYTSYFPPNPNSSHRPRSSPSHSYHQSSRPRTRPLQSSSDPNSHFHSHFHSHSYPPGPPPPPPHPPHSTIPPTNLYTVLNIPCTATATDIKKAHRAMSLKWHPDRAKSGDGDAATERMAEINQANDVLGDETKRAFYDRWGTLPTEIGPRMD